MDVVERAVILPYNRSFTIKEVALKNNKGVIHAHDHYELNFIVDAYGRRFVAGNISRFTPGDLIFMGPGVPHCWEIDNKDDSPRAITIYFNKDFFEKGIMHIPELLPIQGLARRSMRGLFIRGLEEQQLFQSFAQLLHSRGGWTNIIDVIRLLMELSASDHIQTLANEEFQWDVEQPQNQRLKKIYEYVFYNFQKSITLAEVSSLIGLTEGAFCAFFKRNTKKTFSAFIKEVRIGYACKLLLADTDMPISQICFESGFNNFANFNRQFKEITRLSPKEFRARQAM